MNYLHEHSDFINEHLVQEMLGLTPEEKVLKYNGSKFKDLRYDMRCIIFNVFDGTTDMNRFDTLKELFRLFWPYEADYLLLNTLFLNRAPSCQMMLSAIRKENYFQETNYELLTFWGKKIFDLTNNISIKRNVESRDLNRFVIANSPVELSINNDRYYRFSKSLKRFAAWLLDELKNDTIKNKEKQDDVIFKIIVFTKYWNLDGRTSNSNSMESSIIFLNSLNKNFVENISNSNFAETIDRIRQILNSLFVKIVHTPLTFNETKKPEDKAGFFIQLDRFKENIERSIALGATNYNQSYEQLILKLIDNDEFLNKKVHDVIQYKLNSFDLPSEDELKDILNHADDKLRNMILKKMYLFNLN